MRSIDTFLSKVCDEMERARQKYPAPNPNTAALGGEVGEVMEAMNKESFENVYAECVQVAVMAMRLAVEGDPFMDAYRGSQGLDLSSSEAELSEMLNYRAGF